MTGCLKPAPASTDTASATTGTAGTTGTTGTAGTTAAAGATDAAGAQYVLADAATSPSSEAATQSAAGATTTASKESTQTYRLIANPTALAPHVGKKLELTGTIVDASASSTTASQASSGSGPVLKVEAGKVLAASCQN